MAKNLKSWFVELTKEGNDDTVPVKIFIRDGNLLTKGYLLKTLSRELLEVYSEYKLDRMQLQKGELLLTFIP